MKPFKRPPESPIPDSVEVKDRPAHHPPTGTGGQAANDPGWSSCSPSGSCPPIGAQEPRCWFVLLILALLSALNGCGSDHGIDLTKGEAGSLIRKAYGYPREVMVSVEVSGWGTPDVRIFTPQSKGPDLTIDEEAARAIVDHAVKRGWLKLTRSAADKRDGDYSKFRIEPAGEPPNRWEIDRSNLMGDRLVTRFGVSHFKKVTGIAGAVGAEKYEVTYTDEVEVAKEWRGAGGRILADNRVTGDLSVEFYRFSDGWRVQEF